MKIIKKAKSENRKKFQGTYYENHHIFPKSLFPLWEKKKSNLVLLTAREHFFCHQLLDKIYPNSNMFVALWRLSNNKKYKVNSKQYEKLKIKFSNYMSEKMKNNHPFKGKYHSQETKRKISQTKSFQMKGLPPNNKGVKRSEKAKLKSSENLKKAHQEKQFGWGFFDPWNKGLNYFEIYSEEERKKFGHNQSGEKNGFYGKKHSKETKEKISKNKKGNSPAWNKGIIGFCSGEKNGKAKKIICTTTGEVFGAISLAIKKYPSLKSKGYLIQCLKGERQNYGTSEKGESLSWKYYET
jgi:hypothetical protein